MAVNAGFRAFPFCKMVISKRKTSLFQHPCQFFQCHMLSPPAITSVPSPLPVPESAQPVPPQERSVEMPLSFRLFQRMTELQQMGQLVPVPGIHHDFHRIGSFLRGLRRPALCISTGLHRGIFLDVLPCLCPCLCTASYHLQQAVHTLSSPSMITSAIWLTVHLSPVILSPPDLPACEFQTLLLIIQMIHTHNVIHLITKQDPVGDRQCTAVFTVPHRAQ